MSARCLRQCLREESLEGLGVTRQRIHLHTFFSFFSIEVLLHIDMWRTPGRSEGRKRLQTSALSANRRSHQPFFVHTLAANVCLMSAPRRRVPACSGLR